MSENSSAPTRLRNLGIAIGTGEPGTFNAITDVPGVRVGHVTLIEGEGLLEPGLGPVRTGITAIHPHDRSTFQSNVPAAIEVLNGAGEITGRSLVDEFGVLETPILLTNTFSVGEAHRGCVEWLVEREPDLEARGWLIPVVAETYDGFLNDIVGQHVTVGHAKQALEIAATGPVMEGNVGGGTGMTLFGFKGGIGSSSRRFTIGSTEYTIGVLVQGNFGSRQDLLVDGVPVGREMTDLLPERAGSQQPKDGSIIVVIATDVPLADRQLRRICKRAILGLGRVGSIAGHTSGDIMLSFSNAEACRVPFRSDHVLLNQARVRDDAMDNLFRMTIEATTESVLNAMIAAKTMKGRDGNTAHAIPHDRLIEIMRKYGRLN